MPPATITVDPGCSWTRSRPTWRCRCCTSTGPPARFGPRTTSPGRARPRLRGEHPTRRRPPDQHHRTGRTSTTLQRLPVAQHQQWLADIFLRLAWAGGANPQVCAWPGAQGPPRNSPTQRRCGSEPGAARFSPGARRPRATQRRARVGGSAARGAVRGQRLRPPRLRRADSGLRGLRRSHTHSDTAWVGCPSAARDRDLPARRPTTPPYIGVSARGTAPVSCPQPAGSPLRPIRSPAVQLPAEAGRTRHPRVDPRPQPHGDGER